MTAKLIQCCKTNSHLSTLLRLIYHTNVPDILKVSIFPVSSIPNIAYAIRHGTNTKIQTLMDQLQVEDSTKISYYKS